MPACTMSAQLVAAQELLECVHQTPGVFVHPAVRVLQDEYGGLGLFISTQAPPEHGSSRWFGVAPDELLFSIPRHVMLEQGSTVLASQLQERSLHMDPPKLEQQLHRQGGAQPSISSTDCNMYSLPGQQQHEAAENRDFVTVQRHHQEECGLQQQEQQGEHSLQQQEGHGVEKQEGCGVEHQEGRGVQQQDQQPVRRAHVDQAQQQHQHAAGTLADPAAEPHRAAQQAQCIHTPLAQQLLRLVQATGIPAAGSQAASGTPQRTITDLIALQSTAASASSDRQPLANACAQQGPSPPPMQHHSNSVQQQRSNNVQSPHESQSDLHPHESLLQKYLSCLPTLEQLRNVLPSLWALQPVDHLPASWALQSKDKTTALEAAHDWPFMATHTGPDATVPTTWPALQAAATSQLSTQQGAEQEWLLQRLPYLRLLLQLLQASPSGVQALTEQMDVLLPIVRQQLAAQAATQQQLQAHAATQQQLQAHAATQQQLQAHAATQQQLQAQEATQQQLQAHAATEQQLQAHAATQQQLQAHATKRHIPLPAQSSCDVGKASPAVQVDAHMQALLPAAAGPAQHMPDQSVTVTAVGLEESFGDDALTAHATAPPAAEAAAAPAEEAPALAQAAAASAEAASAEAAATEGTSPPAESAATTAALSCWAYGICWSRAIHLWDGPTLLPLADFMNHQHPPNVMCMARTRSPSDDDDVSDEQQDRQQHVGSPQQCDINTHSTAQQCFECYAVRPIPPGGQLHWTYLSHNHDAGWLCSYGFVPEDGRSSQPSIAHVAQLIQHTSQDSSVASTKALNEASEGHDNMSDLCEGGGRSDVSEDHGTEERSLEQGRHQDAREQGGSCTINCTTDDGEDGLGYLQDGPSLMDKEQQKEQLKAVVQEYDTALDLLAQYACDGHNIDEQTICTAGASQQPGPAADVDVDVNAAYELPAAEPSEDVLHDCAAMTGNENMASKTANRTLAVPSGLTYALRTFLQRERHEVQQLVDGL